MSEIQEADLLAEDVLRATRLYAATSDPGLQDSYHKMAETARAELYERGYGTLAFAMGEDKTLEEKLAVHAKWKRDLIALGASFTTPSGLADPPKLPSQTPGGTGILAGLASGAGSVVKAGGSALEYLSQPGILQWVPWLIGGAILARMLRVKLNLGGR